MELLPYETLFNILLSLSYQQIINFCQTNRQYYSICQDNNFWAIKAVREFKITVKQFYQSQLTGQDRYLQLLAEVGDICVPGSERIIDVNKCLGLVSANNNIKLIDYFITKGADDINYALLQAAKNGHLEVIRYLLSLLPEDTIIPRDVLKEALILATYGQHQLIIKYLITLGKFFHQLDVNYIFPFTEDLNEALITAAITGNIQIYDYLVSLGSDLCSIADNLNATLFATAQYNHPDLIIHIANLARKKRYTIDLSLALYGAAYGGHQELIDKLLTLDNHLNNGRFLNNALYQAAIGGHQKIIDHLLSLGADDINQLLIGAAIGNHQQLINYALSLNATELDLALVSATGAGNIDLIPYLIELGATSLDQAIINAINNDQVETVKYLLLEGSNLKQKYPQLILSTIEQLEDNNILGLASKHNDVELLNYLVSLGSELRELPLI